MTTVRSKVCFKCKLLKGSSEYRAQKRIYLHSYCKPCEKEYQALRRTLFPNTFKATQQRYVQNHPAKRKESSATYAKNNRASVNTLTAGYRAKKLKATPIWSNLFFIEEAYILAALRTKMLGFSWNVDHIIPLRGVNVCGLHVEYNLQVITELDNKRKGNRINDDR